MEREGIFRLKAAIQQYDWGKTGGQSLAARLARNAIGDDFTMDPKESYAEVSSTLTVSDKTGV